MAEGVTLEALPPNIGKFYCHKCERDVSASTTSELICPKCSSGCLEEIGLNCGNPEYIEQSLINFFDGFPYIPPHLSESTRRSILEEDTEDSAESEIDIESEMTTAEDLREIHRRLNIPFTPEDHEDDQESFLNSLVSDHLYGIRYFDGEYNSDDDVDDLASQLLDEIDLSGPPPLSKEQLKALPVYMFTSDSKTKEVQCTVCMEDFIIGDKAKKLNCAHLFHEKCISPWLEKQASCPNCRLAVKVELPPKPQELSPRRSSRNSTTRRLSDTLRNPFRFV